MSRPIAIFASLIALLALAAPRADADGLPVDSILSRHATPTGLRAALLEYADQRSQADPEASGEALYLAGESWFHDGLPDSAIITWERAWARRRSAPEGDALIEALLALRGSDNLDRAHTLILARMGQAKQASEPEFAAALGRLAWWHAVSERPDSAAALFEGNERWLVDAGGPMEWVWRARIGQAMAESSHPGKSANYLISLAARSFTSDRRVLSLLSDAFVGGIKSAMPLIQTELNVIIGDRNNLLKAMGGREVAYLAADGFKVSAVILAPPGKRRFRAAVGLVNPDEPFDAWDSLAIRLRSAGTAVILVEARGSGRSRSAEIPSPETWRGNEAALEELVAQDVSLAVRALAQAVAVDTSRVLLIAGLQGATAATEAAARDPRFHALLLASPTPHSVDQGRAIANLARRRMRVYITNAPTDVYPYSMSVSDLLLHASDERASRISDSLRPGPGVMLFRSDPQAFPRFRQWMEEAWARPAPKAGVRPTR